MDAKWIGVGMAMLGSVALGLGLSRAVGGRAEALASLVRAMRLLAARLLSLHEPMEQAEAALHLDAELFARLAESYEVDTLIRWRDALDGIHSLTAADRDEALRLISDVTSAGRDGQRGVLDAGLALLAERADEAARQAAGDRKLYRELGFLGAIAIVILAL